MCVCVFVRVCVYMFRVCVCMFNVCVCVRTHMHVCIQLNGIVLLTYVDPTSLDYLLSPLNEDAVLSAFLET